MQPFSETLLWAFSLGTLPALVWLIFWLREDKRHPEPKTAIILCFLFGGAAVFASVLFEKMTLSLLGISTVGIIFAWSFIEEGFKYIAARLGGLRQSWYNEPIDAVVYLLTAALGFAAVENTLYVSNFFTSSLVLEGVLVGNLRFVGASLLHFLASVTLGMFIAFSFYKRPWVRRLYTLAGLFTAILLHALFNLLIMKDVLGHTMLAFLLVWICIVVIIALFERIKKLSPLSEELT